MRSSEQFPSPADDEDAELVRREIAEEFGVEMDDVTIDRGPDGMNIMIRTTRCHGGFWQSGAC
jgi:hypothetical protein